MLNYFRHIWSEHGSGAGTDMSVKKHSVVYYNWKIHDGASYI